MGARSSQGSVCGGESAQVEIQVLEAADLEALLTQTVTEALSFDRTARESEQRKEPLGIPSQ